MYALIFWTQNSWIAKTVRTRIVTFGKQTPYWAQCLFLKFLTSGLSWQIVFSLYYKCIQILNWIQLVVRPTKMENYLGTQDMRNPMLLFCDDMMIYYHLRTAWKFCNNRNQTQVVRWPLRGVLHDYLLNHFFPPRLSLSQQFLEAALMGRILSPHRKSGQHSRFLFTTWTECLMNLQVKRRQTICPKYKMVADMIPRKTRSSTTPWVNLFTSLANPHIKIRRSSYFWM